jgi:SPP1 family predicted phage head-tail adaptor
MRAGTLDQRITIESRTDAVDTVGQPIPTWGAFAANIPAGFDQIRGREFFTAQALTVVEAAMFRIRYLPGTIAGHRVQYDGKVWDIASVEQVFGRDREMHLFCATGLTAG